MGVGEGLERGTAGGIAERRERSVMDLDLGIGVERERMGKRGSADEEKKEQQRGIERRAAGKSSSRRDEGEEQRSGASSAAARTWEEGGAAVFFFECWQLTAKFIDQ